MAHGQNSKKILKVVNGIMIFLGLLIVGFASWALYDSASVLQLTSVDFPKYAFWAALFFGLFVTFISFLGSCSTKTDSKLGFAFYIAVVFAALIAQLCAASYLGMKYGIIHEAALVDAGVDDDYSKVAQAVQDFEASIVAEAAANPEDWVKTQKLFGCCGYDALRLTEQADWASDVVDTGPVCTDNQAAIESQYDATAKDASTALNGVNGFSFCKAKVVKKLEDYSLYVGIVAGVLAFIQLICLLAASRLACCVSKKDGGYMQDWRPSTKDREEQYAATDLTGMGPSTGGGPMVGP